MTRTQRIVHYRVWLWLFGVLGAILALALLRRSASAAASASIVVEAEP